MNDITCPFCQKKFELSQALKHQIEESVSKKNQEEYELKLRKITAEIAETTEKKIKAESLKELEKATKEKEVLENKLLKEQEDREKFEKKISEEASKKADEEQRLKLKEKDLQLDEIRKVNEDLKRKLEQGSQQRQGEVLELDLEEQLKQKFPNDEFVPIPKGVEGADIWQKVRFNQKVVGSILWETKRTKAWSNGWITKLKDDAAKVSASESIIVSQVLPEDSTSFDRKDGVWITTYEHAINICRYIRFLITRIYSMKSSTSQTAEDWTQIKDYMLSDTFRHRMQAHFDGVKALRDGLDAEKRATLLRWKKQESQIEKLDANTVNFYGELREIVPNLPEIKGVDSPLLEEGETNEQETLV
jgi:hypothetical protein